ncbi:isochorismatase family protein [Hyphomicrobium sp. MC8b]|uniref:isochorismatase family protein n=1 Tax=Hyphomicrobium sp. MC8b TaxID=300273 RepID=UPI00391B0188
MGGAPQTAAANYQGVWGGRIGFGDRPALLVVDFLKAYTRKESPLFALGVVDAVANTPELLAAARQAGIFVVHTRILYSAPDCADGGIWVKKAPVMKAMVEGNVLAEFCEGVEPEKDEPVIVKQYASSFFGTSLASLLHTQKVDTVVIAGCSTSGCVRATAVDAVQYGFRTIVVRDCVGDRHPEPHAANLFDIDSKYGDVVSKADAIAAIKAAQTTR